MPPRNSTAGIVAREGLGRLHLRFGTERADPSRVRGGDTRAGKPTLITFGAPQPSGTPKRAEPSKFQIPNSCTLGPRPSGQTTGYGCRNAHPTLSVGWKRPRAPPLAAVHATRRDRDPPTRTLTGSHRGSPKMPPALYLCRGAGMACHAEHE